MRNRADWIAAMALMLGFAINAAPSSVAAGAQQRVPDEMVLALVKNMYQELGSPEPAILVGEMPAELRSRTYLPDNARVHGSVVYDDRATVIVGVDLGVEETKAALRREMPALGWRPAEAYDNIGPQTQGAILIPIAFCNEANDSILVLVDSRGSDGERSLLRMDYAGDKEGSICRPRPQPRRPQPRRTDVPRGPERMAARDRLRLGDMRHPPLSPMASGRCPSGESSSSTMISTEFSGPEIVQHYAAQLEAVGWTRSEPGDSPASFTASWQQELEGEPYVVVLQLVQLPQREHCFSIRLSSNGGLPRR